MFANVGNGVVPEPLCDKSITELQAQNANPVFPPNLRELLCILEVLPVGSSEAERSFSCLRQVHNWLQSTVSDERLSSLEISAISGFKYPTDIQEFCDKYTLTINDYL